MGKKKILLLHVHVVTLSSTTWIICVNEAARGKTAYRGGWRQKTPFSVPEAFCPTLLSPKRGATVLGNGSIGVVEVEAFWGPFVGLFFIPFLGQLYFNTMVCIFGLGLGAYAGLRLWVSVDVVLVNT